MPGKAQRGGIAAYSHELQRSQALRGACAGRYANGATAGRGTRSPLPLGVTLKTRIEAVERQVLRETLLRNDWNKSRATEELGLSRVRLRSKLEHYSLDPD